MSWGHKMTVTLSETTESGKENVELDPTSGEFVIQTATLEYLAFGSSDDNVSDAREAAEATIPKTYGDLPLSSFAPEPYAENLNLRVWKITANYGKANRTDATPGGAGSENEVSFEIRGETVHVQQSIQTLHTFRAPWQKSEIKTGGALNVDISNGVVTVQGVDDTTGVFAFSETKTFENSAITQTYKKNVLALYNKTNTLPFRGHKAGEVLFLGMSGSRSGPGGRWNMRFSFAVNPEATNLILGEITIPKKGGWEYLNISYRTHLDGGELTKVPAQVSVEQLKYSGDFSQLMIG